ncbi:uncharacterized protein LOC116541517 isoform X2 [Sapajus apella]|uniref:Uncharacterized protein LOC116541517 isoform X2 n=1 Tax=Sapajus apella TaxID=9515 RepID=A0A6J3GVY7_SAPAP|nr:uncharacterized protein LOC116541517 isoform X2 [Sapajus apella]
MQINFRLGSPPPPGSAPVRCNPRLPRTPCVVSGPGHAPFPDSRCQSQGGGGRACGGAGRRRQRQRPGPGGVRNVGKSRLLHLPRGFGSQSAELSHSTDCLALEAENIYCLARWRGSLWTPLLRGLRPSHQSVPVSDGPRITSSLDSKESPLQWLPPSACPHLAFRRCLVTSVRE